MMNNTEHLMENSAMVNMGKYLVHEVYSSECSYTYNWKARNGRLGQRTSIAHGIPIKYRDEVLAYFRSLGRSVKLAYRGPSHPVSGYKRKQSYIHKYMATSFAVYPRGFN